MPAAQGPLPTNLPPSRRFYDHDLEDLHQQFGVTWNDRDNVNALAIFGQIAKYRFWDVLAAESYNPSLPSIVSSFAPKSGGTFLHNRLLQAGYLEYWWCFPDLGCHSWVYASDEALRYFLTGGCACHTHARPHANVLAALDRAGVERVWVHLRDPAACVVSAYHHFLGEGHGEGEVGGTSRQMQAITQARENKLPLHDRDRFVVDQVDWFVEWTVQWLEFATTHPDRVFLTYYHQFSDVTALLSLVFAEFGVRPTGAVTAQPVAEDRKREKATSDWRQELSPGTAAFIDQRVDERLLRFDQYEAVRRGLG